MRAVDAYLRLTADQTSDYDFLEEMWEKVRSAVFANRPAYRDVSSMSVLFILLV